MRWLKLLLMLVLCGCSTSVPSTRPRPEPLDQVGLHNVFRVSEKLFSGSSPEGEEGFASLNKLGIKTVLSVDGATPEIDLAQKFNLRYVHLPVNYDGISQEKAWLIAKAVRDLPGPIYLHCHHGKHRGPCAAAAVRLCLEKTYTPEEAESWMKAAGTDPKYKNLINLPRTLQRPSSQDLDKLPSDFPSIAPVPTLTKIMVSIDARWDALKAHQKSNWNKLAEAHHEAVQLHELYREANRQGTPSHQDMSFLKLMQEAEAEALKLEKALQTKPFSTDQVRANFLANQTLCNRCHTQFRD